LILSISQAHVADATRENLFGAWSDLQVGERPDGLVDCYLLETDGVVQIASIWASVEHHDEAVAGNGRHPGLLVFAACGLDPAHKIYTVRGQLE
jgi:hypothetical protein